VEPSDPYYLQQPILSYPVQQPTTTIEYLPPIVETHPVLSAPVVHQPTIEYLPPIVLSQPHHGVDVTQPLPIAVSPGITTPVQQIEPTQPSVAESQGV
jgi:hypothetical protein